MTTTTLGLATIVRDYLDDNGTTVVQEYSNWYGVRSLAWREGTRIRWDAEIVDVSGIELKHVLARTCGRWEHELVDMTPMQHDALRRAVRALATDAEPVDALDMPDPQPRQATRKGRNTGKRTTRKGGRQ